MGISTHFWVPFVLSKRTDLLSLDISINKNACIQSSILLGLKEGGISHSTSTLLFSAVLKTGLLTLMLHTADAVIPWRHLGPLDRGVWSLLPSQRQCLVSVYCALVGSETGEGSPLFGSRISSSSPSAFELDTACLLFYLATFSLGQWHAQTHTPSLLSPEANEV